MRLLKSKCGRMDTILTKMLPIEDVMDFQRRGEYEIHFDREFHIGMEFEMFNGILPHLFSKNWLLIRATESSGPFTTTDNPVKLEWKDPDCLFPLFCEIAQASRCLMFRSSSLFLKGWLC